MQAGNGPFVSYLICKDNERNRAERMWQNFKQIYKQIMFSRLTCSTEYLLILASFTIHL